MTGCTGSTNGARRAQGHCRRAIRRPLGGAAGGARRDCRDRAGPRHGRRGALAPDRPEAVIDERFGVAYHERTVGKLLKQIGFSHVSARPRHPARKRRRSRRLKKFRGDAEGPLADLPKGKPIEIWFQDEARIGQKNGLVRQWARRGTRPRQPADQRYESAYLFGAICPARGIGAALAMPYADTEAMQLHLDEISAVGAAPTPCCSSTGPAGTRPALVVPKNITLIFLPSRSPELNPVENIWQYLRENWLSNRVFETYDDIIDAACDAWRNLIAEPTIITSIGLRDWAHVYGPNLAICFGGQPVT